MFRVRSTDDDHKVADEVVPDSTSGSAAHLLSPAGSARPHRPSVITGTTSSSASPISLQRGPAAQGTQYSDKFLNLVTVTGNMGNHSFDEPALDAITNMLRVNSIDLMVLNVQEASYSKMQRQLSDALNGVDCLDADRAYIVGAIMQGSDGDTPAAMSTKTKWDAWNTGITSLFIYPNTADISIAAATIDKAHPHIKIKRRHGTEEDMPRKGSANNKGGVISRLIVTKWGQEFRIDTMSAHLDSDIVSTRLNDWLIMFQAAHPERLSAYPVLEVLASDSMLIGMDANVRDHAIAKEDELLRRNLYLAHSLEVAPFLNAVFGPLYATAKTSYHDDAHANILDKKATADSLKRRGVFGELLFASGPLDLIGISMPSEQELPSVINIINNDEEEHESTLGMRLVVPDTEKNKRDHAMIISPIYSYSAAKSEVGKERVKQYLINMLFATAPALAQSIKKLSVLDERFEPIMLSLYNTYLATTHVDERGGLVSLFFKQHLRLIKRLEESTLQDLVQHDEDKKRSADEIDFYRRFFDGQGPWCALNGMWSNLLAPSIDPLSQEYSSLLHIKYDFQELLHAAFLEANTATQKKQVLYLAEKLLRQPGISPDVLCDRFRLVLEFNNTIFVMEELVVSGKDSQGVFAPFVRGWLTCLDVLHDNKDFYLTKLKQFAQMAKKQLIKAEKLCQITGNDVFSSFIDIAGPLLKKINEEVIVLEENFRLAADVGHARFRLGVHSRASSFFASTHGSSDDEHIRPAIGRRLLRSTSDKFLETPVEEPDSSLSPRAQ